MRKFPTVHLTKVYHIGTMNPADKGKQSYEGGGLSISLHPEVWRRITPLPGLIHKLYKDDACFLDYHKLSKKQKAAIQEWGLEKGYIKEELIFQVTFYDDEMGMNLCTIYRLHEESMVREEMKEGQKVKVMIGIVSTPQMDEKVKFSDSATSNAHHLLTTLFVEEVLHWDGVWWQDVLDPQRFSAPRGVINVEQLPSWNIQVIGATRDGEDIEGEEDEEGISGEDIG